MLLLLLLLLLPSCTGVVRLCLCVCRGGGGGRRRRRRHRNGSCGGVCGSSMLHLLHEWPCIRLCAQHGTSHQVRRAEFAQSLRAVAVDSCTQVGRDALHVHASGCVREAWKSLHRVPRIVQTTTTARLLAVFAVFAVEVAPMVVVVVVVVVRRRSRRRRTTSTCTGTSC